MAKAADWLQCMAAVVQHEHVGDVHKLVLHAPEVAARAEAGQFVQIKPVPGRFTGVDPLLRRPLSLCEIDRTAGTISVIYRSVGRGTELLALAPVGAELDLIGPLGSGFPDPAQGTGRVVLVGGGLGIPPMVAAAARCLAAGRPVAAIIGARSAAYLAGYTELQTLGVEVTVVTDDGSAGQQALVVDPLVQELACGRAAEVWACGPEGALVAIKLVCARAGVPLWVSVERHMACGIGVCMGCTVPRADGAGYLKCCVDGPVFRAEEVRLIGER